MKNQNILLGATFSNDANVQCHVVFDDRNHVPERLASGTELQSHGLDLGILIGRAPWERGRVGAWH